ncbi:MAG: phage integrase SAM-like domain-containing protein [Flavobacteriales bacterium]|nr:phage integrase SAM-like domain-containing protein [Flavobacteriales bacterium]
MATIKFLLQSKSGNSQIYIRISLSRTVSIKRRTGFSIDYKDWSEATSRPKQNNPENKNITNNLNKLETYVFDSLNNDLGNGKLIDGFWLESKINGCFNRVVISDNSLIINHIKHIIDTANTRKLENNSKIGLSKNTIKNYGTFLKLIQSYTKYLKKEILFMNINKPFVENFTNWLINIEEYSINYSGKNIEMLKTVCNDAEKNEIKVNPYCKQIKGFRLSNEDKFIVTLSFEELEQIRVAEMPDEALNNARNWILLGCEIGQRGGDLLSITEDNIRYKGNSIYIDLIQQKTKKNVTIGIIAPHVIDIVKNHLPYKIPNQKFNELFKEVCKIAKINEVVEGVKLDIELNRIKKGFYPKHEIIASHCCRRSFATNYYKKIPTPVLMNITGHTKESIFLSYINQREDKDTNADLFIKFYEDLHKNKHPELILIKNGTNN